MNQPLIAAFVKVLKVEMFGETELFTACSTDAGPYLQLTCNVYRSRNSKLSLHNVTCEVQLFDIDCLNMIEFSDWHLVMKGRIFEIDQNILKISFGGMVTEFSSPKIPHVQLGQQCVLTLRNVKEPSRKRKTTQK